MAIFVLFFWSKGNIPLDLIRFAFKSFLKEP